MTSVGVAIPWRDSGCEHRRASWDWLRAGWAVRHPEWPVTSADTEHEPFNIPAALNATVRATSEDILIVTGADAQVSADGLRRAVSAIEEGAAEWVMAGHELLRLDALVSEKAVRSPVGGTLPQVGARRPCQLGWGVLVARREVFLEVPWDETLGLAWEDSAWGYAAATLFGEPWIQPKTSVRLLWHPRVKRHKLPGYAEAEARMELYRHAHRIGDQSRVRELLAQGVSA